MKYLFKKIRSNEWKHLSSIVATVGVLLPALLISIGVSFFQNNNEIQDFLTGISVFVLIICSGLLGLIYIVRKEISTFITVRGKAAEVQGYFLVFVSIILMIMVIIRFLGITPK